MGYAYFVSLHKLTQPTSYQAMAASMLTSALAFGCLILAETTVLKILAQVVASGVLLGFLLCPIIIGKSKQAED